MNSGIQLLMNSDGFKNIIITNKNNGNNIRKIYEFLKEYESSNRYIAPNEIKNSWSQKKNVWRIWSTR